MQKYKNKAQNQVDVMVWDNKLNNSLNSETTRNNRAFHTRAITVMKTLKAEEIPPYKLLKAPLLFPCVPFLIW